MATYSPELLYKKIDDAQEIFGGLSQTSQFMVSLNLGRSAIRQRGIGELNRYLTNCGLFSQSKGTSETYDFLCSEATLPGSTFNVIEETGSRQGMIERFPMQRIYSEFDLTFYVDREYNTIRLFEEWMNWIDPLNTGGDVYDGDEDGQEGLNERTSFYRLRYPNSYKTDISVIKFERGFWRNPNTDNQTSQLQRQPILKYNFIEAFPLNTVAIPLSYDGSDITKITISFAYTRYTVAKQNPRPSTNQRNSINLSSDNVRIASSSASTASTAAVPVGYIDGQPYYGAFHEHTRADGTVVRMVGSEHVGTPHAVIYGTVAESIAQTVSTPTPSPASSPNPSPSPAASPNPSPSPAPSPTPSPAPSPTPTPSPAPSPSPSPAPSPSPSPAPSPSPSPSPGY